MEKPRQVAADDLARLPWSPTNGKFRFGVGSNGSGNGGQTKVVGSEPNNSNSSGNMKERLLAQSKRRDLSSQREPALACARWPRSEQVAQSQQAQHQRQLSVAADGDFWPNWAYQKQQQQQSPRSPQSPLSPPGSANQAKPRLPRGVSKIPRQVNANGGSPNHSYQQIESEETTASTATILTRAPPDYYGNFNGHGNTSDGNDNDDDGGSSSDICSATKYLTFSKDQATSHFKSLQEELSIFGSQKRQQRHELGRQEPVSPPGGSRVCGIAAEAFLTPTVTTATKLDSISASSSNIVETATTNTTTSPIGPRPAERQRFKASTDKQQQQQSPQPIRAAATSSDEQITTTTITTAERADTVDQVDNALTASGNFRQQPVCEAFIMTGQSMLKLSCNESENNNNKNNNNNGNSSHNYLSHQSNNSNGIIRQQNEQALLKSHSWNKLNSGTCSSNCANNNNNNNNNKSGGGNGKHTVQQQHVSNEDIARHTTQQPGEQGYIGGEINGDRRCSQPTVELVAKKTRSTTEMMSPAISLTKVSLTDARERIPSRPRPESPESKVEPRQQHRPSQLQLSLQVPPQPQIQQQQAIAADEVGHQQQRSENGSPTTPICNDRESARRLAKRLYNLSGFKRSDVCHHLYKNNPFSQMVAEEYLNLFDFRAMKLDGALRKFLSKLQLNGETQERERLLGQFSQRYYDCNKEKFPSADTVQTLVCALVLLNTDLHTGGRKRRPKLSLGAFIDGLNHSLSTNAAADVQGTGQLAAAAASLGSSNGQLLPRHLLIDLYESIKKRPLKCSEDKCDMSSFEAELDKMYSQQAAGSRSNTLPTRRFVPGSNAPSSTLSAGARRHLKQGLGKLNGTSQEFSESAIEFRSGFVNRKRVFEPHGKPTGRGRRAWRRVQATLQDLRLVLRPGSAQEEAAVATASSGRLPRRASTATDDDQRQQQQQQQQEQTAKQSAKSKSQAIAQDMRNTIKIHHTFAKRSTSYTKREFVFHLRLADQSEFLMQANSEQDMTAWIDTINFAAACLSSPALPSAVTNGSSRHRPRPLLPAAYTRLSYWEQLIDYEERLQRLKLELDEHLSQAPDARKANKRAQAEFIEKIACLKQDIERYGAYVDLMRKKSNSPEAIILSKHPQIASLTPSNEMVLSLPSFAPPNSVAAAAAASATTTTTNSNCDNTITAAAAATAGNKTQAA